MTQAEAQYRLRITFGKNGTLRFIGHLDLAKTWERVFRRARLPLIYSKGFNPQPKMQFAAALPLGISSECEIVDVWLKAQLPLETLPEQLNAVSPPGLETLHVVEVNAKGPALQTQVQSAEYRVITGETDDADLRARIAALLAQAHIERERRGKSYDLRPLILGIEFQGEGRFLARLALGEAGTGRPDELLSALGLLPNKARIHRFAIHLKNEGTPQEKSR